MAQSSFALGSRMTEAPGQYASKLRMQAQVECLETCCSPLDLQRPARLEKSFFRRGLRRHRLPVEYSSLSATASPTTAETFFYLPEGHILLGAAAVAF